MDGAPATEAIRKAQEVINTMVAIRNYLTIVEKGKVGPEEISIGPVEIDLYLKTVKNLLTEARYRLDELWTILER